MWTLRLQALAGGFRCSQSQASSFPVSSACAKLSQPADNGGFIFKVQKWYDWYRSSHLTLGQKVEKHISQTVKLFYEVISQIYIVTNGQLKYLHYIQTYFHLVQHPT